LSEEEQGIQDRHSLTLEQMSWRRWAIKNKCQSDVSLFRQEYPATWQEAFQATGNAVFTNEMIDYQESYAVKTPRHCVFTGDLAHIAVEDVDRVFNCWQIKQMPRNGHQYAMGIDTMEGRLSDIQNVKSKLDCDAAAILDRTTGDFVAIYHGRGSQIDFAHQCLLGAKLYNEAWAAPEIPAGMLLLNAFKEAGYRKIYNRQIHDERLVVEESENLGWRTTLITRRWLVDDFTGCLRDKAIRVGFGVFIDQMRTFVRDTNGKPIHRPDKHDDVLFSGMIAVQVHKRCPLDIRPYPNDHTGESIEPEKDRSLAYVGAIDTFEPGEEDDYD